MTFEYLFDNIELNIKFKVV